MTKVAPSWPGDSQIAVSKKKNDQPSAHWGLKQLPSTFYAKMII